MPESHSEGALARNAVYLLIAQIISTVLAVVFTAAVGRRLGPAAFGVFFLATSIAGFALVVLEWGQGQYVVREVAQDPGREPSLVGTALALRLAGGILMTGLTALLSWMLGYEARVCGLVAFMVAMMLPFFLAQGIGLVFRARERMEWDAIVAVTDRLLTLAATLVALTLGGGAFGAAGGVGAGGAAALGAAFAFLRRLRVPRFAAKARDVRPILLGGAAIVATNVEGSLQPYLDAVVLSKLGSVQSLGWYAAARTFTGTLIAPAIILSIAAYPRLSRFAADRARLRRELSLVLKPLIGVAMLACIGSYLFARQAVDLVYGGRDFAPAALILQVLAPGLLLLFVDNMLGATVVAIGRPKPLAIAKLVNIAVGTGLAILLVPAFEATHGNGGVGLAIASASSELIMLGAALLILPAGSLDPSLLMALGRALAAGAGTVLVFRALGAVPLALGVPLCVIVFTGLSIACGLVKRAELAALPRLLRRPADEERTAST